MQGNAKYCPKTVKDRFGNMFRISSFGGAFPFTFVDNNLHLSYIFLLYTITYLLLMFSTMGIIVSFLIKDKSNKLNTYALMISNFTHVLVPLSIPTVSVFWLWINIKKLSKVFSALKRVEEFTQYYDSLIYLSHYFVLFLLSVPMFVVGYTCCSIPVHVIATLCLITINTYLVMVQFTSILATIRNHYSFLEDTLYNTTAMEWARCHEILGACCEMVNKCYSPQLFIFTLATFSYTTSTIYILISQRYYFQYGERIMAVLWVIMYILLIFVIVFNCQETVAKAKRFDKALYRLVLNDSTKQLLRNKRIRHHFKAKRKVEFTAMGFFNFDYSLIGTMVSTATTYIVIMVQFTP